MPKIADAPFSGTSGSYEFEVYPLNTTFNAVGAVYVFTKRTVDASGRGTHALIYIGQTDSLADRIPNHEKLPCIRQYGANCICVHRDETEPSRLEKETDLRAAFRTPCNEQ
jgi:hypothetical protein